MSCHHVPGGLQDLLDETWGADKPQPKPMPKLPILGATPVEPPKVDGATLSTYQFDKKIEKTMDEYVRPMLKNDGGNIEIVDIKGTLVYCRLTGACSGCEHANQTLRMLVERTLKEMVDERIKVIDV